MYTPETLALEYAMQIDINTEISDLTFENYNNQILSFGVPNAKYPLENNFVSMYKFFATETDLFFASDFGRFNVDDLKNYNVFYQFLVDISLMNEC